MIKTRSLLFAVMFTCAASCASQAADVVYPTGSRIGMTPPPGMIMSQGFLGFEDAAKNVAFVMAGLPPEAFAEIAKSTTADALKKQGLTFEKREELTLPAGKAFVVVARQQVDNMSLRKWITVAAAPQMTALVTVQVPDTATEAYPENAIRTALATISVRPSVPVDEQLSLLPFKVSELADFHVGAVMAGRAVLLTDATDPAKSPGEPHIVVAIAPGGPAQNGDRGNFAQDVFSAIPDLREVRIDSSEPLRVGGAPGHQIMAHAKQNGADVTVVQWLRFGNNAYVQMVGVAPASAWTAAYARFRQVRDGIEGRGG
jgi:hypothetical protein